MLFDKNGFYLPEEFNESYDFGINILDGTYNNFKVYSPTEALMYGNLFPDLYCKYKDYNPDAPSVCNPREKLMLNIQTLEFCITDLNLYLDLHPNDTYAYQLFKDYASDVKKLKKEYNKIYGPISLEQKNDEYEWSKSVWPWEERSI